jgi:hypothetical protein
VNPTDSTTFVKKNDGPIVEEIHQPLKLPRLRLPTTLTTEAAATVSTEATAPAVSTIPTAAFMTATMAPMVSAITATCILATVAAVVAGVCLRG